MPHSTQEPAGGEGNAKGTQPAVYRNPFRGVRNLNPERVDMGVDYAGTGPVYALGPGVITSAGDAWRGAVGAPYPGTWITERLTKGPLAGRTVYVAEDIYNVRVHPGQRVNSSTVLGDLQGGLETGFAAPGAPGTEGETLAAQLGQASSSGDPGANPTAAGSAYSTILHNAGAPAGIQSGQPVGTNPSWLTGILAGLDRAFGGTGATGASLAGDVSGLAGIAQALQNLEHGIAWLFVPSNWVRILCFSAGSGLVVLGVVTMTRTGKSYSVSVPAYGAVPAPGGELAPAMGIAEVTLGAILLFFAFHNLQAMGVNNFQDLVTYIKDRAHGQAPQAAA